MSWRYHMRYIPPREPPSNVCWISVSASTSELPCCDQYPNAGHLHHVGLLSCAGQDQRLRRSAYETGRQLGRRHTEHRGAVTLRTISTSLTESRRSPSTASVTARPFVEDEIEWNWLLSRRVEERLVLQTEDEADAFNRTDVSSSIIGSRDGLAG